MVPTCMFWSVMLDLYQVFGLQFHNWIFSESY